MMDLGDRWPRERKEEEKRTLEMKTSDIRARGPRVKEGDQAVRWPRSSRGLRRCPEETEKRVRQSGRVSNWKRRRRLYKPERAKKKH